MTRGAASKAASDNRWWCLDLQTGALVGPVGESFMLRPNQAHWLAWCALRSFHPPRRFGALQQALNVQDNAHYRPLGEILDLFKAMRVQAPFDSTWRLVGGTEILVFGAAEE